MRLRIRGQYRVDENGKIIPICEPQGSLVPYETPVSNSVQSFMSGRSVGWHLLIGVGMLMTSAVLLGTVAWLVRHL